MTKKQIIEAIGTVKGNYSLATFKRDAEKLKIEPIGFRQRPQQFSPTAVAMILAARGFESALAPLAPILSRSTTPPPSFSSAKLATIEQLKREKSNALSRRSKTKGAK